MTIAKLNNPKDRETIIGGLLDEVYDVPIGESGQTNEL